MGSRPDPGPMKMGGGPASAEASGLDEAAADRVARQLDTVTHPELLEHVRAVAIDRLLADEENFGDLLTGVALGDQLHHLELAWCQWLGNHLLPTLRPPRLK